MQLAWDVHFHRIVIAAWQAYRRAEEDLSRALAAADPSRIEQARFEALREGGAAAFYVHHYAEVVLRARPPWLASGANELADVLNQARSHCTASRSTRKIDDLSLLGDVADALKHAVLTRRLHAREVAANDEVLVVGTGFGQIPFGEGEYGGAEQVVVLAKSGPRPLSSVLQNVVDAWRRAAGMPLPDIGDA